MTFSVTGWNLTSEEDMELNATLGAKRLGILESQAMGLLRDEIWGQVDQCRAPFRVISLDGLKKFGKLPRSSDGQVVLLSALPEDAIIIFISQVWLNRWGPDPDHPDDENKTIFGIIVEGTESLIQARGWDASKVFLWTDYGGIDQDDAENRMAGIEAILGYTALCTCMLIPCSTPPSQNAHTIDEIPGGYADGAWTRLQSAAFYCSSSLRHELRPEIYVASHNFLKRFEFVMDEQQEPEQGQFLREADRASFRKAQNIIFGALRSAKEFRGALVRAESGISALSYRSCLSCGDQCSEACQDAKLLAAAGLWASGEILLVNAGTGTLKSSLRGHQGNVWCLAWSRDGTNLVSGGADRTVRLWLGTGARGGLGQSMVLEGHSGHVMSVAFSPDGLTVASGSSDRCVMLWDIAAAGKGTPVRATALEGHADVVSSVAFSPDGATLASGSFDRTVRLWDVVAGKERQAGVLQGHAGFVCCVAFSRDGTVLASAGQDKVIRLWGGVISGAEGPVVLLRSLEGHTNTISTIAFSPDGSTLASGSADMSVRLWEVETWEARFGRVLEGHCGFVNALSFSPDGSVITTGSQDKTIKSWDLTSSWRSSSEAAACPVNPILCVNVSKNGKLVATGSVDKTIRVYDIHTGEEKVNLPGHEAHVTCVAWCPLEKLGDGLTLASGSFDCTIRLWQHIESGNEDLAVTCLLLRGHTHLVYSVAFSSDGTTIASGSQDKTVRLWELSAGVGGSMAVKSKILQGHTNTISSVAFSPDGSNLASASFDCTVRLWTIDSSAQDGESALLKGHTAIVYSVAFSPDGTMLASGSMDKTIRLWNVSAAKQVPPKVQVCIMDAHGPVFAVAFSPDGSTLASGCDDSAVVLWSCTTGAAKTTLAGHCASINSVAYGANGATLVSGCSDGTVLVWRDGRPAQILFDWDLNSFSGTGELKDLARQLRTAGIARQCSVGGYIVRAERDRVVVCRPDSAFPLATYTAPLGVYSIVCSGRHVLVGLSDRRIVRLECSMLSQD